MKRKQKKVQTLSDIFLNIMEQNADAATKKSINRVLAMMEIPAYAELFNFALINAVGGRKPISKDTVHKAIDCIIRINKEDIDNSHETEQAKELQKIEMESWMNLIEEKIIIELRKRLLLIE